LTTPHPLPQYFTVDFPFVNISLRCCAGNASHDKKIPINGLNQKSGLFWTATATFSFICT